MARPLFGRRWPMLTNELRQLLERERKDIQNQFLARREEQLQLDKVTQYAAWYELEVKCAQLNEEFNRKSDEIRGLALGNFQQIPLFKDGRFRAN